MREDCDRCGRPAVVALAATVPHGTFVSPVCKECSDYARDLFPVSVWVREVSLAEGDVMAVMDDAEESKAVLDSVFRSRAAIFDLRTILP